jgi:hypothetical protein
MSNEIQNRRAGNLLARVQWKMLAKIVVPTLIADLAFYFYLYPRPAVIGFLGDLYNFIGGIWLARDLLFKEDESEREEALKKLRKDYSKYRADKAEKEGGEAAAKEPGNEAASEVEKPADEALFKVGGVSIREDADLGRVFDRRKAEEAISACLLLGLGLALLLLTRMLEWAEQGRVEKMWEYLRHAL